MEKQNIPFKDIKHFSHFGKILRYNLIDDADDMPIVESVDVVYKGVMRIETSTPQINNVGELSYYDVWIPLQKSGGVIFCPTRENDVVYVKRFNEAIKGIVRNIYPSQLGIRLYVQRESWNSEDEIIFNDL